MLSWFSAGTWGMWQQLSLGTLVVGVAERDMWNKITQGLCLGPPNRILQMGGGLGWDGQSFLEWGSWKGPWEKVAQGLRMSRFWEVNWRGGIWWEEMRETSVTTEVKFDRMLLKKNTLIKWEEGNVSRLFPSVPKYLSRSFCCSNTPRVGTANSGVGLVPDIGRGVGSRASQHLLYLQRGTVTWLSLSGWGPASPGLLISAEDPEMKKSLYVGENS